MHSLDTVLYSFGLDPNLVREALEKGRVEEVLAWLQKEDSRLALRRLELEDLREALMAWGKKDGSCGSDEELSDEDMELLSAAGEEIRMDP